MRILIIDDERLVSNMIRKLLTGHGYSVDACYDGRTGIEQAKRLTYDLVLLDWQMPDVDGVTVLRELRAAALTSPVIMLTSRDEARDKAFVLDAGADDYVVKPFEVDELLARIRAVLRRTQQLGEIRVGDLHLDRLRHVATIAGKKVDLTAKEIDFLFCLAARQGHVVSKVELLRDVWGYAFDPGSNIVEVTVSRMRGKLEAYDWVVATERGRGYRFRTSKQDDAHD